MPKKEPKRLPTTTINTNMDEAIRKMDDDGVDRLVIAETVGGRRFTVLEIERKVGPLAKDNNNNNLC
jgi:hypothetical protein